MKALAKTKRAPGFELIDTPVPKVGAGEVLVRVKCSSICGSDVHLYQWLPWMAEYVRKVPIIAGHETAGEVVAIGEEVTEVQEGDFVALETHIVCGSCYQCRTGRMHVCRNLKILGFDVDGSFAEFVKVPAKNCWKVPSSIPREWVSLLEPMGNAADTILAEPISGQKVAILGCGPIGLMCVAIAKACGAALIIASEPNPVRRELAKKMGADIVVNPDEQDLIEIVLSETNGDGVDAVAEVSGHPQAFLQAIEIVTPGGWIAWLGIYNRPVTFNPSDAIMKAIRLHAVTGRKMFSTWETVTRLVASGKVDLEPLITHRFPLEQFEDAFQSIINREAIKVVFEVS
ncbi:MAG: L-threonine 3-dehydrogenase [Candidatus Fervidibacter sp.]|uniref:L-threonine 3-dehydrogenase n=1 Tax=Candidatus Fervidibacter sp. TaxID=3100871 RepID=UPI00404B32A5